MVRTKGYGLTVLIRSVPKTPMRVKNFGIEPDNTLLKSETVAIASVNTLFSFLTGEVVDVKNMR